MTAFAHRHRQRLTLVSKFTPDAKLFAPPPKAKRRHKGRPRVKGKALPSPAKSVAKRKAKRLRVRWYGGGGRNVEVVTGQGQWYKSGQGAIPVLWVYVHDVSGTHRDEYFFTTDMMGSVRRYLWMEWIFARVPGGEAVQKISKPIHALIDFALIQVV